MVPVDIIDDDLIEHDEDFFLAVKGRGRTVFGRAIIIDDDTPGPPVHVSNPVVPEGEGPIPASRVRFLSPSRIRRMARDYQVRIASSDEGPPGGFAGPTGRGAGRAKRAAFAGRRRASHAPSAHPRPRGPPSSTAPIASPGEVEAGRRQARNRQARYARYAASARTRTASEA